MKDVYTFCMVCVFFVSAQAEVSGVLLTDNQYKVTSSLNSMNAYDAGQLKIVWEKDTVLSGIPFNDFIGTMQVLHMNPDTTYINNKDTYAVCKQLTENYLNETNDIIEGFQSYTDKENNKFYKQNVLAYLAIHLFQLFYVKGTQYILLQSNIQDALKPKIVGDMILKSIEETKLRNELVFIAKNSKYNLYNF